MNIPPSSKTSASSYGRFTSHTTPTEEANKAILEKREAYQDIVKLAASIAFDKDVPFKDVPYAKLVEFYLGLREQAHELFGTVVPYEHQEYIVITEFSKTLFTMAPEDDSNVVMRMFFVGSDVLFRSRRQKIVYDSRPWAVFFERFLDSQKNTEWAIGIALFATWSDPTKCQFDRNEIRLILRAHLSALGMRLAMLSEKQPAELIATLLHHDSCVLVASASKNARSALTRQKRDLISVCHRVLSNISLYRNENGLVL